MEAVSIIVRTLSGNVFTQTDDQGQVFVIVPKAAPVETPEQAAVEKQIIGRNGVAISFNERKKVNTDVRSTSNFTGTFQTGEILVTNNSINGNVAAGSFKGTNQTYQVTLPNGLSGVKTLIIKNFTFTNGSSANQTQQLLNLSKPNGVRQLILNDLTNHVNTNGSIINSSIFYTEYTLPTQKTNYDLAEYINSTGFQSAAAQNYSRVQKSEFLEF